MTSFYNALAKIVSSVFSISLFTVIGRFFRKVYWYSYRKRFKYCGEDAFIEYPFVIRGASCITIGKNTIIAPRLRLDAIAEEAGQKFSPQVSIGADVTINYDCHIGCVNKVTIGDRVLIAGKVYISDHSHGDTSHATLRQPPAERPIISTGPVEIGNDVWIGESVSILPNVTIGNNSIIGANSVVTKSIPPFTVAGGVPARILKSFDETV